MIRKALMAATLILLILLVILVPRLGGVQEDISSLPRLILNFDEGQDSLILFVTSLSGTYLYSMIYLNLSYGSGEVSYTINGSNTHGLEYAVDLASLSQGQYSVGGFDLEVVAIDKRDSQFDLSLQVSVTPVSGDWDFEMVFEDDPPRFMSSQDLVSSPLATLLQRRSST